MRENFLSLGPEIRRAVYESASQQVGRLPDVLEKDVWVCWVLQQLFSMPGGPRLAFKGGTSLSKVYGLIDRFSEDVDVSYDYRDLGVEVPDGLAGMSNKARDRVGDQLREGVKEYTHQKVVPYFAGILGLEFPEARVTANESGERLEVHYPVATAPTSGYMGQRVLVEFGGRNSTEPSETRAVSAYMAEHYPDLAFPNAQVVVLRAERTFWEKATLIHAEVNRGKVPDSYERYSRHWHDLYVLGQSVIGPQAIADRALLEQVVAHKKALFRMGSANYDACLTGGLCLVPTDPSLREALERDYAEMRGAGMFASAPPSFEVILEALQQLQNRINQP